jgi:PQQ-like domain
MHRYLMRMCVAAAAGVTLSTVGVAGASASGAAPRAWQAVRVSPAGTSLVAASPGAQLWATRYNGTGNNADVATSVAVSPTGGTVYVTGQSYGTAGVVDYATVAYDAATGTRQWVARYNGPASSLSNVPSSVAVSPDGKTVFVTGKSQVGQFNDYATVAYDAATGHQLWAKGYNGSLNNDDEATSVAVSPTSGTVYVTGFSWGKTTAQDYATIAYNAATGAQQWVKRYNGPPGNGPDDANSVTVSPAGTVYVTGQSFGTSASGMDYATVAYAAAGTQLWVKRYNGPGRNTDDARSVAVSPDGKTVYVTGQSWGGQASAWDYATVAYDAASGAQRWVKRYNGPGNAYDLATSLAVSPTSGTVYVTGQSAGTSTGADYATIAYNAASGAQQWVARYNGTGNGTDLATSLAVSPTSGTVYVTGQSVATSGLYDYATVAYNAAGIQQWVKRPAGSVAYPGWVAVSPTAGTVFVTGANAGDYTTVAYQG